MNVTLVPHIPDVLYVVGSLQWTKRHQTLCWSAHTTVDWSSRFDKTCRIQVPGRRWLQIDTGLMSVPTTFSQLTVEGQVGYIKCLYHFKQCPDSSYLATAVCIVLVSVNTPGLYDSPGFHSDLDWCAIHYHMQSSLTLAYH